jgi:hypothetical protein
VRAKTPQGAPVPDAWIYFTPIASGGEQRIAKPRRGPTDANGAIQFFGLAEGKYVMGGPSVESPTIVDVRGSDPIEYTVTLTSLGAIQVLVRDTQGRGNDALTVAATPKDGGVGAGIGQSRGEGRYDIGPLPAGQYYVELHDGINPTFRAGGQTGAVEVRPGEVAVVHTTYGNQSGRIVGRVLDSTGMPVPNAWIVAQSPDPSMMPMPLPLQAAEHPNLTNAEGRFVVAGLAETAVFSIVATHPLAGEARIDDVHVGQNVDLTVRTPGALGGIVLDARGRPPEYFQITVTNKDKVQTLHPEFGPDAHGKWFVDHVAPGAIEIRAHAAGGIATVLRELAPADRLENLELRLQPLSAN